jgi:uncharacterized membrane protein YeaQ/YmgE (transglycosylase-associated protein family)
MTLAAIAAVVLDPGSLLGWIVVGLIAGAIAGRIVQGRGFGCLADIVVGIIGAFVGGFVISFFIHGTAFGFIGSLIVAVLGAVIFLAILRGLSGGRI